MASVKRLAVVSRFCCQHYTRRSIHATSALAVRDTGYWNKRWQPEHDLPETLEERKIAAKKYGLTVEDYETYDHKRCGDYPKLPEVPRFQRDGHEEWDEPTMRRNFNEPFSKDWDTGGEHRYDGTLEQLYSVSNATAVKYFSIAFGSIFLLYWFAPTLPFQYLKMTPKQYPASNTVLATKGEKHYTFPTKALQH